MQNHSNQTIRAGRAVKNDVQVEIRLDEPFSIEINSSVQSLFGHQIREFIQKFLFDLNFKEGAVSVNDYGALDYVLHARLESAVRKTGKKHSSIEPPKQHIHLPNPQRQQLRRSRLYIPGNTPEYIINAGLFGADSIILDLEDSVMPDHKFEARILVRNALLNIDFNCERIVRINPLRGDYGKQDLEYIIPAKPDVLLVPKCESRQDVLAVETEIQRLQHHYNIDRPILLMPLIETAKGILHAEEIAAASANTIALCFGAEDFTASIGVERTKEEKESLFAKSMIILAAKAANIQALDTVFSDVEDMDGLFKSTCNSVALGFDGRGIIHPGQIKTVHNAFAPGAEQINYAEQVVQAIEQAAEQKTGVAALGSKMIDAPVVRRARKILTLAEIMGLKK
ncbi:citrate lyase ACP [candidate division KSB1 bacterium]|nr:citrate lyase ACP [candidate division KSB1 bacterium]